MSVIIMKMVSLGKKILRVTKTAVRATPLGAGTLMAVDAIQHPKKERKDIIHKNSFLNPVQAAGKIIKDVGAAEDPVKNTVIGKLTSDVVDFTHPLTYLGTKAVQETMATGVKGTTKVAVDTVKEDAGFTLQGVKCAVGASSLGVSKGMEMAFGLPAGSAKWILIVSAAGIGTYFTKQTFNTGNFVNLGLFVGSSYTIMTMLPDETGCKTLVANPRKNKNLLFKDIDLVNVRNGLIIALVIMLGSWGASKAPSIARSFSAYRRNSISSDPPPAVAASRIVSVLDDLA